MRGRTGAVVMVLWLSGCAGTADKLAPLEGYRQAEQSYQAGELQVARSGFEAVLDDDPQHLDARFRLGNIALREQQIEAAQGHYEAVLEQDRRHAKSHYNLALIHLMQAERYFQYYSATAPGSGADTRLLRLLEAIERFSDGGKESDTPLDAITDLLSKEAMTLP